MSINFQFSISFKNEIAAPVNQDKWYNFLLSNGKAKSRVHLFDDFTVPAEQNRYAIAGEEITTPELGWFAKKHDCIATDEAGKSFFKLNINSTKKRLGVSDDEFEQHQHDNPQQLGEFIKLKLMQRLNQDLEDYTNRFEWSISTDHEERTVKTIKLIPDHQKTAVFTSWLKQFDKLWGNRALIEYYKVLINVEGNDDSIAKKLWSAFTTWCGQNYIQWESQLAKEPQDCIQAIMAMMNKVGLEIQDAFNQDESSQSYHENFPKLISTSNGRNVLGRLLDCHINMLAAAMHEVFGTNFHKMKQTLLEEITETANIKKGLSLFQAAFALKFSPYARDSALILKNIRSHKDEDALQRKPEAGSLFKYCVPIENRSAVLHALHLNQPKMYNQHTVSQSNREEFWRRFNLKNVLESIYNIFNESERNLLFRNSNDFLLW